MNEPIHRTTEVVPEIIPWPELQKRAERDGVNIMDYVNGLNAHVQRQRNEINRLRTQKDNLLHAVNAKQAKIDALMLEFCPGEMSAEQREEWARHQAPVDPAVDADVMSALLESPK